MGAILGGTMRSPLTGIVFALELTHDVNMLLPLLVAVTVAHGFTVLTLRRSILTEKVSRRGFHLSREYAIDPLEILFVREVMRTDVVALPARRAASTTLRATARCTAESADRPAASGCIRSSTRIGGSSASSRAATCSEWLDERAARSGGALGRCGARAMPIVAYPDEPLRVVVYRMAETGLTRLPVVERGDARAGRHDRAERSAEGARAEPRRGAAARARARRRSRTRVFGRSSAPVC